MNEQDGTQASTKHRQSRQTSKQNGKQSPVLQRPHDDDIEAWKAYWKTQGQPWRTELEIDMERQKYLADCRSTIPNIEQDIYPFKDIKLCRADVEWLLATHENGRGPIDWRDESQRERKGLDLRGADLRQVDLCGLPLACLCGGLEGEWWNAVPDEQLEKAAIHLEGADLRTTNLKKAQLSGAHMEDADLRATHLERANLCRAHLEGTRLHFANLENAFIRAAHLERAILYTTNLKKAVLSDVHLENTYLNEAYLEGSHLEGIILGDQRRIGPQVADTHWDDTNLAVINWSQVEMLGDECEAQQKKRNGVAKDNAARIKEYERAVRANRQLAVALQAQGMNEIAARFSYRAQVLQRQVLQQHVLRNLEQTKEVLHTQEYEGVGLDELSNILLMFLHLLYLPSSQLIKFEQSQKDFFLKRGRFLTPKISSMESKTHSYLAE